MPSKLLISASDVAHEVTDVERFGVRVPGGLEVDGRAVLQRVRRERDRFVVDEHGDLPVRSRFDHDGVDRGRTVIGRRKRGLFSLSTLE